MMDTIDRDRAVAARSTLLLHVAGSRDSISSEQ